MLKMTIAAAAALIVSTLAAQGPPAPRNPGVFPAQQRPPADPAVVARGKALFGVTCALCHGADLRGGQLNGPNLLRSQLVLSDEAGESIMPVIRGGRPEKGMPPIPMPDEDAKAVRLSPRLMGACDGALVSGRWPWRGWLA